MTDNERELAWRGLVASMPGETHKDRVCSLVIYSIREMMPPETKIDHITISVRLRGVAEEVQITARADRS